MCLIAYNPHGHRLNKNLMRIAYDNNPHGFGVLWLDDNNELSLMKDVTDFKTLWSTLTYLEGYSYALHLRWKTRGEIGTDQCHPFQILSKEEHGFDLYMMHNGTIFGLDDKTKSDTQIFADILKEMYEKNFVGKDLKTFFKFIEGGRETIGSFNKILFLTNSSVKILNRSEGISHNDIWYSNYYSFIKGFRKHQTESKKNYSGYKIRVTDEENG